MYLFLTLVHGDITQWSHLGMWWAKIPGRQCIHIKISHNLWRPIFLRHTTACTTTYFHPNDYVAFFSFSLFFFVNEAENSCLKVCGGGENDKIKLDEGQLRFTVCGGEEKYISESIISMSFRMLLKNWRNAFSSFIKLKEKWKFLFFISKNLIHFESINRKLMTTINNQRCAQNIEILIISWTFLSFHRISNKLRHHATYNFFALIIRNLSRRLGNTRWKWKFNLSSDNNKVKSQGVIFFSRILFLNLKFLTTKIPKIFF